MNFYDTLNNPYRIFIIAEISCNHNQDITNAIKLIEEAKKSGADAVKFQTYRPDTITMDCHKEYFRIKDCPLWENKNLFELYEKTYTPWDWFPQLQKKAHDSGLVFFSSPFDETSVDFLEELDVPCYKIASLELTDHLLLKKVADTKKPVILSTGTSTLEEITEAVNVLKNCGCDQIVLLKCTSAYPTDLSEVNLRTLSDLKDKFSLPVGLSDHTKGIIAPIVAASLGITVIEKHFKLEGDTQSEDHEFSLDPKEFKQMADAVRQTENSLGTVKYYTDSEKGTRALRRSLFVVQDIKKGEKFTKDNIRSIRPAHGLPTKYYHDIIGKPSTQNIERGEPLNWDMVSM